MWFSSDVHFYYNLAILFNFDLKSLSQKFFHFKSWLSSVQNIFISNSLAWCSLSACWLPKFSYNSFCSGHKSWAIFVLTLRTFLIFVSVAVLGLKSFVKILIRAPINDFLTSFSTINSLNSSKIGWIFLWWWPHRWSAFRWQDLSKHPWFVL